MPLLLLNSRANGMNPAKNGYDNFSITIVPQKHPLEMQIPKKTMFGLSIREVVPIETLHA